MGKKAEMQRWCRYFREKEGRDLSADELATKLEEIGWGMPKPKTPHELLARQVSRVQGEETIYDEVLADYVARNICYPVEVDGKHTMLWAESDTASRKKVEKNKTLRRDQMVGDAYQSSLILMRWNRLHPDEEPIQLDLDFGPDVEWKLNSPKERGEAA